MRAIGWLRAESLQLAPGASPVAWYAGLTVLALLVVAIGIYAWMLRSELTREQPIDSEMLVNAFEDPLVVLDPDDEVLVANVAFRSLFGADVADEPIGDVLDSYPEIREAVSERESRAISPEVDGDKHHYQLRAYPAGNEPRPPRKWVILFQDIATHREREQHLEEQNEQLEQFASLISHDLRNPLDVAIGRTNAVADMLDDPELTRHLERAQDSHERMQEIITDVLALARDGHDLGETEHVPLETAAMDAWSHVDTHEASLSVPTQLVVEADRDRLHRVLENLFRNAVEHGGDDVTVRVGELDAGTGFFVEDDGEGIPPEKREAVLEAGYSDCDSGTGLGLAIVRSIAKAHNWSVRVTDSESGGARFEFTGVEQAAGDLPPKAAE
jgi:signal transduction histidine kinase